VLCWAGMLLDAQAVEVAESWFQHPLLCKLLVNQAYMNHHSLMTVPEMRVLEYTPVAERDLAMAALTVAGAEDMPIRRGTLLATESVAARNQMHDRLAEAMVHVGQDEIALICMNPPLAPGTGNDLE